MSTGCCLEPVERNRDRDDVVACLLVYAILALHVADWALTVYGLERGGHELNLLMVPLLASTAMAALALKMVAPAISAAAYGLLRAGGYPRAAFVLLGSLTAVSLAPVLWNLGQVLRWHLGV